MTNEKQTGARIRELRLKHGMTQKELAGDRITRNMLSLIESGTSSPSLATLEYLAERLNVPVGYIFTHSPEEEKVYHKYAVIGDLKRAFAAEDYAACAELCNALPLQYADDEISMISAVSFLKSALQCASRYELSKAHLCLAKAAEYANRTMYLDSSFRHSLEYYTKLFRCLNTTEIPETLTDLSYASPSVPHEMILYFANMALMRAGHTHIIPFLGGTVYERHLLVGLMISEEQYGKALPLLKELTRDADLPYFMRFRVYSDLEIAAEKTGDLRSAYVAARKKLELLGAEKN